MGAKNLMSAIVLMVAVVLAQACLDGGGGAGAIDSRLVPGDKLYAGGEASSSGAKSLRIGAVEIGTVVGYFPLNVPIHQSSLFQVKSNSGYIFTVPNQNVSDDGTVAIQGLGANGAIVPLYFSSTDCTGQAFVANTALSDYGASQGVVFRVNDGALDDVFDNPAQYFYVPAGTPRTEPVAYQSRVDNVSECVPQVGNLQWGYAALPNDPLVTLVSSGPIPIPVTMAEPSP